VSALKRQRDTELYWLHDTTPQYEASKQNERTNERNN